MGFPIESIRRCIKPVREAYAYTDDEVEYLYRRFQNGRDFNATVTEEGESSGHWKQVASKLSSKLDLTEKHGGEL
jgi:hypothetical protein